ncbi:hypothetical protein V8F20_011064 [Naviculisporaceae sp. PSN 640]
MKILFTRIFHLLSVTTSLAFAFPEGAHLRAREEEVKAYIEPRLLEITSKHLTPEIAPKMLSSIAVASHDAGAGNSYVASFQSALLLDRDTESKSDDIENAQPEWFKNLPDDVQSTIKSLRSDLGELKKDVIQRFGNDKKVGDPSLPGAEAEITSLLGPEPTPGSGTGTDRGDKDSGATGRGLEGIVSGILVALTGLGFLRVIM